MMKWLIWVILEGLQASLLADSSFINRLFRFFNVQLPVCNTAPAWWAFDNRLVPLAGLVAVRVSAPRYVPKVFDTSGMERSVPAPLVRALDRSLG
ncbi:MAG: hypothetical protein ACYC6Y_06945 [Thermoguttaceae bacterium]